MGNSVGTAVGALGPLGPQGPGRPSYRPASPTYGPPGGLRGLNGNPNYPNAPDPMLSQLSQYWNLGRLANLPQETAINNNINSYLQQLGLIGANQKMQTGYINEDNSLGNARIGLNREQLGIQRGALERQGILDPRLHQLNLEELAQQGEQNIFQAEGQRRDLTSQAVQAGALQSVGARQGFSDIDKQLQFGQRNVLRGTQRENLSFEERQAQRADDRKQLDLAAKGLDLDARELSNRTSRALQELGLSSALNTQDVIRAINDLNAGRYNPIQALLGTIYQASGVRPTVR